MENASWKPHASRSVCKKCCIAVSPQTAVHRGRFDVPNARRKSMLPASRSLYCCLLQLCVLYFSFLQDGDVRVTVFPKSQKVFVGS
jgi:hypothetical protein